MCTRVRERGFSLIELLTVVGIIGILLAITVPNIMEWLKLYRLRAAAQELTGELQSARMQAVMRNARFGVTLYIVDSNSYRWVNLDLAKNPNAAVQAQALAPLRDLPQDIVFQSAALGGTATTGLRFTRLGAACAQGVADNCALEPAVEAVICDAGSEPRCDDDTSTTVRMVSNGAITQVGLLNTRNGLTRALRIGLGGRVEGQ